METVRIILLVLNNRLSHKEQNIREGVIVLPVCFISWKMCAEMPNTVAARCTVMVELH